MDQATRFNIMFGLETELLKLDEGSGATLDIFELILEVEKFGKDNLEKHLAQLTYEINLTADYPILTTYFHESRLAPLKLLLYSSNSSQRQICQYLLDETLSAVDSAPADNNEDFKQLLLLIARKFVQEETF